MHRGRGASGDVRARGPGFPPRSPPCFHPSRNTLPSREGGLMRIRTPGRRAVEQGGRGGGGLGRKPGSCSTFRSAAPPHRTSVGRIGTSGDPCPNKPHPQWFGALGHGPDTALQPGVGGGGRRGGAIPGARDAVAAGRQPRPGAGRRGRPRQGARVLPAPGGEGEAGASRRVPPPPPGTARRPAAARGRPPAMRSASRRRPHRPPGPPPARGVHRRRRGGGRQGCVQGKARAGQVG